jgi:hypothetical protein
MEHRRAAPIGTLALAVTLALGVLLVAPDTEAAPARTHQVVPLSP